MKEEDQKWWWIRLVDGYLVKIKLACIESFRLGEGVKTCWDSHPLDGRKVPSEFWIIGMASGDKFEVSAAFFDQMIHLRIIEWSQELEKDNEDSK